MSNVLDNINGPEYIKSLSTKDLGQLAYDVRQMIIETVGRNGGHLGANLGVVELTIAMLKIFNPPEDKVLWDTTHQTYPWKILTDRKDQFSTIRQTDGISGFQKRSESPYDAFGAGHAGTALSAALGMAVARDQRGSDEHVISVVGDAAIGNGISLEALNNLSHATKRMIVVLNDNDMSIDENVGSISKYLGKLLSNPTYNHAKEAIEKAIKHAVPSKTVSDVYHKMEEAAKGFFLKDVLFEEFGLRYVGPIDGHDIEKCLDALEIAKNSDRPILLHFVTVKGKGYQLAEENQTAWHGPAPFDPESGKPLKTGGGTKWSIAFGDALSRLAEDDERIVAITAGTRTGCGLAGFYEKFPKRIFDVGMTEAHAVVFACGMACEGLRPVFAVYSTFSQRSIDNVIHDAALQDLPVMLCLDRAGFVGDDGPTHHGIYDIVFFRPIPGVVIMQPKDEAELGNMLHSAFKWENKTVVMRYPRGSAPVGGPAENFEFIEPGTAEVLEEGTDIQIWALGDMIPLAQDTAALLRKNGFNAGVVNARFAKPIDTALLDSQSHCRVIASMENGAVVGGLGSAIEEYVSEKGYNVRVEKFGWPDEFITHGKVDAIYARYGLTPEAMAERIEEGMAVRI